MAAVLPLPPLSPARLVWVTLALSLATFMQVLDTTIANVAIPTISGHFGASTSQGTWVITSFGVANAIAVPITGWLAKRVARCAYFCSRLLALSCRLGCVAWHGIWRC